MAKKEISRTEIFENMPVFRAILTLAVPTIINQLANVVYNLADTFYIGRLNNSSMVAALTVTTAVMIGLTALSNLFCIGSCTVIAAALGSKNRKKAEDIALLAPLMALVTGIVVMVLVIILKRPLAVYSGASETSIEYAMQYQFWVLGMNAIPMLVSTTIGAGFRGYGYSKYEMLGITLGNVLNIILDPIFIFVFKLGVVGAGSATFVSTVISLLFFFFMSQRMQKREHLYTEFSLFRFNRGYAWEVITTGFPAFLHSFLASITNTLGMNIYKTYSDAAVAAIGIVRKIEHFFGQIIIGLNQGTIPLISYNYAAKQYDRLSNVRKKTIIMGLIWAAISFLILFPFARQFMTFFINDEATIAYGTPLVKMYSFICLTMSLNNNTRTTLQALGQKTKSSLFSMLRQIVLFIPMIFILNKLFGFYGAGFTPIACDIISDAIGIVLMHNVMKKIKKECEIPGSQG